MAWSTFIKVPKSRKNDLDKYFPSEILFSMVLYIIFFYHSDSLDVVQAFGFVLQSVKNLFIYLSILCSYSEEVYSQSQQSCKISASSSSSDIADMDELFPATADDDANPLWVQSVCRQDHYESAPE